MLRIEDRTYGIRANSPKGMSFLKCLQSLIAPNNNEFINLYVYLAFAIYFWIQMFLIIFEDSSYDFNNQYDYYYMFIITFGAVVSLTFTFFYYLLYPMSKETRDLWSTINIMGLYTMIYCLTFAFICSEDAATPLCFFLQFITPCFLTAALILTSQGDICREVAKWLTVGFTGFVFFVDLAFFSSRRQIRVFYVPVIIEGIFLAIGLTLWILRIPERWCKDSKFVQIWANSDVFLSVFIVNFVFEIHSIMYYLLKANSNYL